MDELKKITLDVNTDFENKMVELNYQDELVLCMTKEQAIFFAQMILEKTLNLF